MALYVYRIAGGSLYSWSPNDTDPVADAATLAANGLALVTGLPGLDAAHGWDTATKTVVSVTPPPPPQPLLTGIWILRFTPAEFQAIAASADAQVQQIMYALNHTTQVDLSLPQMINSVNYLVSVNLLTAARALVVMAVPASISGP